MVGNAIKFTEEGVILVRVTLAQRTPGQAVLSFSVADSGQGIPADKLDQLFRPFTQLGASTTRKFGGTGLGLAICRQLVDLIGGSIVVHS